MPAQAFNDLYLIIIAHQNWLHQLSDPRDTACFLYEQHFYYSATGNVVKVVYNQGKVNYYWGCKNLWALIVGNSNS